MALLPAASKTPGTQVPTHSWVPKAPRVTPPPAPPQNQLLLQGQGLAAHPGQPA